MFFFTATYPDGIPVPGRSVPTTRIFELYINSCNQKQQHKITAIDQVNQVAIKLVYFLFPKYRNKTLEEITLKKNYTVLMFILCVLFFPSFLHPNKALYKSITKDGINLI